MFGLSNISELLLSAVAVLITLSVHEYAHAYAAYKLGDDTAKNEGRLSLNPIKHLDPVGAIFMLLFHFGWAKPVPINPINFRKPKRDFAIVALAGPLSNIVSAFITTLLFLIAYKLLLPLVPGGFGYVLLYNTCLFLSTYSAINVGLGVFNLIPIPPFDGSRILNALLPERLYFKVMKYERKIYWGVIAWLFFGRYVTRGLLSVPFIAANPVLSAISRIFDLSDLIGIAISAIYNAMISFWQLIPALA